MDRPRRSSFYVVSCRLAEYLPMIENLPDECETFLPELQSEAVRVAFMIHCIDIISYIYASG